MIRLHGKIPEYYSTGSIPQWGILKTVYSGMQNLHLRAKKILTFIPSGGHYERSIELFKEIGFTLDFKSPSFAALTIDACSFILQNYRNDWALGNFMMVL
jgi:hypothetical protein